MSEKPSTLVAVLMGGKSDWETMRHASETFDKFGIAHECRVLSAHLAGVAASHTVPPVFGVPIESASLKGLDSLLSTVQMPAGIPVGMLGIGKPGAINAALLAVAVLAAARPDLRAYRREQARTTLGTTDLQWHFASQGWGGTKSPLVCEYHQYDPTTDFSQWWQHSKVVQNTWDTVVSSSTYKVLEAYQGTGSDGRDPGANIDFVNWATAGAATGAANPFLDMKIRSIQASSNSATLYVTAPSSQACAVELSPSNRFDTLAGSAEYFQTGKDVRANVSGLTPGTYYFDRARCDGYQLESTLLTSP